MLQLYLKYIIFTIAYTIMAMSISKN